MKASDAMHFETYRQAWLTLKACSYPRNHFGTTRYGWVVHIGLYESDGVCAKVEYPSFAPDWYRYDRGWAVKMDRAPTGRITSVIPPGCSL